MGAFVALERIGGPLASSKRCAYIDPTMERELMSGQTYEHRGQRCTLIKPAGCGMAAVRFDGSSDLKRVLSCELLPPSSTQATRPST